MDGHGFDRLARSIARRGTRRGAVRAAIGALAGAAFLGVGRGTAEAQDGGLAPGASCSSTTQCSQVGGATVCADNGIADDGALNCCRQEGGACASPNGCCGVFQCIGGVCTTTGATAPTTGATGTGALGAACATTADCAASTAGSVICGDNGIADDGPLTCCLEEGGACGVDDSLCCGTLSCNDGFCGAYQFGDLLPGEICAAAGECSQGLGPAACEAAADGQARCCLLDATSCSTDAECCGGLSCADNGIAADGGLNCCGFEGVACASDAGCCAYLFCIEGVCQPL